MLFLQAESRLGGKRYEFGARDLRAFWRPLGQLAFLEFDERQAGPWFHCRHYRFHPSSAILHVMQDVADEYEVGVGIHAGIVGLDELYLDVLDPSCHGPMMDMTNHLCFGIRSDDSPGRDHSCQTKAEIARACPKIEDDFIALQTKGLHHFVGLLPSQAIGSLEELDVFGDIFEWPHVGRINPLLS